MEIPEKTEHHSERPGAEEGKRGKRGQERREKYRGVLGLKVEGGLLGKGGGRALQQKAMKEGRRKEKER